MKIYYPAVSSAAFSKPKCMSFPCIVSPAAACCTVVPALPPRWWGCSVRQRPWATQTREGSEAGPEKVGHLPGHPAPLGRAGLRGTACSHHAVPPPPRANTEPLTCFRRGHPLRALLVGPLSRSPWPRPPSCFSSASCPGLGGALSPRPVKEPSPAPSEESKGS